MKGNGGSKGLVGGVVVIVVLLLVAFVGVRFVQHRNLVSAALVGDSITDQSRSVLERELGSAYSVEVDGVGGARVDQMQGEADKLAATKPQQLVINLGTNDVVGKFPVDQSIQQYEAMIAKFPDVKCLHLVTVNENIVSFTDPELPKRTADFNNRVRDLANRHHGRVIDWAQIVKDYLAAGEPDGHLSSDTIHPTEMGQQKLAAAYLASLDACRSSLV
jgi:lysophospholipase L1-like esterase